jgi:lipopolysaccharide export system permease protein
MLAVALAVPPKRSSSALGVFLSIVMIVAYHKVNQYAAAIAALGKVNPVLALWTPFVIFSLLIWWMYYTLAYKPGGQPIGALERGAAKMGGAMRRWFLILRRRHVVPA